MCKNNNILKSFSPFKNNSLKFTILLKFINYFAKSTHKLHQKKISRSKQRPSLKTPRTQRPSVRFHTQLNFIQLVSYIKNDETAFARFVRKVLGRSLYINYYGYAQYQHLARAKKSKNFILTILVA